MRARPVSRVARQLLRAVGQGPHFGELPCRFCVGEQYGFGSQAHNVTWDVSVEDESTVAVEVAASLALDGCDIGDLP